MAGFLCAESVSHCLYWRKTNFDSQTLRPSKSTTWATATLHYQSGSSGQGRSSATARPAEKTNITAPISCRGLTAVAARKISPRSWWLSSATDPNKTLAG